MQMPTTCCPLKIRPQAPDAADARLAQGVIASLYNRIAPVYNLWAFLTESRARQRALHLAEIQDGQQILEVAVGTGLAFEEIVRRNPNGHNLGVDLSEGMLEKAKHRLARLPSGDYALRTGNAMNLDAEDGSFDLVFNAYMFDLIFFDQMDAILSEFKRVLKRGGKLVLVNMTRGERCGSTAFERVYRWAPKIMGGCRGVVMADRLVQSGFQVQVREYHQQMGFPSEVILAVK